MFEVLYHWTYGWTRYLMYLQNVCDPAVQQYSTLKAAMWLNYAMNNVCCLCKTATYESGPGLVWLTKLKNIVCPYHIPSHTFLQTFPKNKSMPDIISYPYFWKHKMMWIKFKYSTLPAIPPKEWKECGVLSDISCHRGQAVCINNMNLNLSLKFLMTHCI